MKITLSREQVTKTIRSWVIRPLDRLWVIVGSVLGYPFMAYVIARICVYCLAASMVFAAIGVTVSFVLVWARFTRSGQSTIKASLRDRLGILAASGLLIGLATAGFSVLSELCYHFGLGSLKGGPFTGGQVLDFAYSSYAWHLVNAVPLLQIPSTIQWKLSHPLGGAFQGWLIVIYTIVVIIPFIYLGAQLIGTLVKDAAANVNNAPAAIDDVAAENKRLRSELTGPERSERRARSQGLQSLSDGFATQKAAAPPAAGTAPFAPFLAH